MKFTQEIPEIFEIPWQSVLTKKWLEDYMLRINLNIDFLVWKEWKERWEYLYELISSLEIHLEKERWNLRKNQISSFEKLIDFLKSWRVEWLIKQPTWAWKTRLFWEILKAIWKTSLILVPRTTLVWDTKKEFVWDESRDISGFWFDENNIYTIDSTNKSSFKWNATEQVEKILNNIKKGDVIITTYQSFVAAMKKNPKLVDDFIKKLDVVISDEAHRSTWDKTKESISKISEPGDIDLAEKEIEENFKKMHLRFTATPKLLEKDVQDTYDIDIIDWLTLKEVVDDGTLIFPIYINPWVATHRTEENPWNITNNYLANLSESWKFVMENWESVEENLTNIYLEKKEENNWYLPAVAFCSTIKQAEDYKNYLNSLWIKAVRATSSNKEYDIWEHADDVKQMFHNETVDVVVTVSKVWEGWDVPTLRASIWLTPRNSPADKIQWVWRTMRKLNPNSHHPKKDSSNTYLFEPTFKISNNKVDKWPWDWWGWPPGPKKWDWTLYESKSFFEMLIESEEYDLESIKDMLSEAEYYKLISKIDKEEKLRIDEEKYESKKRKKLEELTIDKIKSILLENIPGMLYLYPDNRGWFDKGIIIDSISFKASDFYEFLPDYIIEEANWYNVLNENKVWTIAYYLFGIDEMKKVKWLASDILLSELFYLEEKEFKEVLKSFISLDDLYNNKEWKWYDSNKVLRIKNIEIKVSKLYEDDFIKSDYSHYELNERDKDLLDDNEFNNLSWKIAFYLYWMEEIKKIDSIKLRELEALSKEDLKKVLLKYIPDINELYDVDKELWASKFKIFLIEGAKIRISKLDKLITDEYDEGYNDELGYNLAKFLFWEEEIKKLKWTEKIFILEWLYNLDYEKLKGKLKEYILDVSEYYIEKNWLWIWVWDNTSIEIDGFNFSIYELNKLLPYGVKNKAKEEYLFNYTHRTNNGKYESENENSIMTMLYYLYGKDILFNKIDIINSSIEENNVKRLKREFEEQEKERLRKYNDVSIDKNEIIGSYKNLLWDDWYWISDKIFDERYNFLSEKVFDWLLDESQKLEISSIKNPIARFSYLVWWKEALEYFDSKKNIREKNKDLITLDGFDFNDKEKLKLYFVNILDYLPEWKKFPEYAIENSFWKLSTDELWRKFKVYHKLHNLSAQFNIYNQDYIAKFLYWEESEKIIKERDEKLRLEKEETKIEYEKNKKIKELEDEEIRKKELDTLDEYSENNNKKQELLETLPKEHFSFIEDNLDEVDEKWILQYKNLSIERIEFIVNKLDEDITDFEESELDDFQKMSLNQIRAELD